MSHPHVAGRRIHGPGMQMVSQGKPFVHPVAPSARRRNYRRMLRNRSIIAACRCIGQWRIALEGDENRKATDDANPRLLLGTESAWDAGARPAGGALVGWGRVG